MAKKYVLTENELRFLLEDRFFLQNLEYAGVDNWHGYEETETVTEGELREALRHYQPLGVI